MLDGDEFAGDVRHDEERDASLGVGGVPFFVIDESLGVSGAPPDVHLGALEPAWTAAHPVTVVAGHGDGGAEEPGCTDGTCAV